MTTSHQLDNLRANANLAVPLKRALRLVHEIADITFGESSRTDRWQLEKQLDWRMQEAQALIETLGWSQPQAKKLVSQLLTEMQHAAPKGDRSYLSIEEAMGTKATG
jgi:hypothetical protein